MIAVQTNLIDLIWRDSRPEFPGTSMYVHSIEYSGKINHALFKNQDNF